MLNKYGFDERLSDIEPWGMPPWVSSDNLFPDEFPGVNFPKGILLREDAHALLEHARGKDIVVDFGTYLGLSASIMSMVAKQVYTIDVYMLFNGLTFDQVQEAGLSRFENVIAIEGDTDIVANRFPFAPVDLVFIDALHDYDSVKRNYKSWFPNVKVGGEILFHDYQAIHPDIIKFVQEEIFIDKKVKVIDKRGTVVAFEKLRW